MCKMCQVSCEQLSVSLKYLDGVHCGGGWEGEAMCLLVGRVGWGVFVYSVVFLLTRDHC